MIIQTSNPKLAFVDSLRGIAILMVILVHTSQSVYKMSQAIVSLANYGQLGVQLFFVISAFTLSTSADFRDNEQDKNKRFFIRRYFRIAPLYYTGIIFYFLFNSAKETLNAGYLQLSQDYNILNILANITFVHGFYSPANNVIVPGGWSIGTEMAFYFCFPLLFFVYRKMSQKGTAFFLITFTLIIGLYYASEYLFLKITGLSVENNSFIYFNLLNQLPVFTLGILAYFLSKKQIPAKTPTPLKFILFILSGVCTIYLWHIHLRYSYSFMFIPFTAGLAFFFLYSIFSTIEGLNLPILQRIGQLSYSMYIFHFIFAWDLTARVNELLKNIIQPDLRIEIAYIVTIFCTYLLAIFSEKYIEKPGIAFGKKLIQKISNEKQQSC